MLEKIRENLQGKIAWAIVIVICSSFVMWGVTDYLTQGNGQSIAAKVNGHKISWRLVESNYQRSKDQYESVGLDDNSARLYVRDALIQRQILVQDARSLGFQVDERQIAAALLQISAFKVDGKFSKDRYLDVLSRAQYTDASFRQELTTDVLLDQLKEGLIRSSFVLPTESKRMVELIEEARDFGYVILPLQKFKSEVEATPEQIKSYYSSAKTQFIKPEQVSLEYVELSLDDIARSFKISMSDQKAYYQEHIHSFSVPERLQVRHILIPADPASKENSAEAEAKANSLLAKVRSGEDFAVLAKEHSIDTASAEKGGDIGWFTKGQMVPAFETAAFGLKEPKEIAGPVRTQYGYHIIQLLARKPAEIRPFEEVQALILEQCQKDKAQEVFAEKSEQLAKLAFENPKSLEPIAVSLGVGIQETESFARKTEAEQPKEEGSTSKLSSYPAIQKAAFSEAVLENKNNSEPILVKEGLLVVVRVKKHELATQLALKEVEDKIRISIITEKATQKAKEMAEMIQKRISNGEDPIRVTNAFQLKWEKKTAVTRKAVPASIDALILTTAFQMPRRQQEKSSASSIVSLASGDVALLMLDKVTPGNFDKLDARMKETYQHNLLQLCSNIELSLYVNSTKQKAKVVIPKPSR